MDKYFFALNEMSKLEKNLAWFGRQLRNPDINLVDNIKPTRIKSSKKSDHISDKIYIIII